MIVNLNHVNKMKKILISFITIFINLYCLGQSLPMPDVVNINFPGGTEKLSEQQYLNFMSSHFSDKVIRNYHDHVYKKGDILFSYRNQAVTKKMFEESLELLQKQYKFSMENSSPMIKSKIVSYNNIRYVIVEGNKGIIM